ARTGRAAAGGQCAPRVLAGGSGTQASSRARPEPSIGRDTSGPRTPFGCQPPGPSSEPMSAFLSACYVSPGWRTSPDMRRPNEFWGPPVWGVARLGVRRRILRRPRRPAASQPPDAAGRPRRAEEGTEHAHTEPVQGTIIGQGGVLLFAQLVLYRGAPLRLPRGESRTRRNPSVRLGE